MSKNNTLINMNDFAFDMYYNETAKNVSHCDTVQHFQDKYRQDKAITCHLENLVNTYGRDEVITMIQRLKLTRKTNKRQAS